MVTSMVASLASWFTPIVFFCFLNLMIAVIFIASNYKVTQNSHEPGPGPGQGQENPPLHQHIFRTPALLDRVKSFNFNQFKFHVYDPPPPSGEENPRPLSGASSILDRVKSINFSTYKQPESDPLEMEPLEEDPPAGEVRMEAEEVRMEKLDDYRVTRTRSETHGETRARMPAKMKKSASEKMVSFESEEAVDRRRPATVRERKVTPANDAASSSSSGDVDEGVDAKADDFILRFKQQLKLQRLDSLVRFNRGSTK